MATAHEAYEALRQISGSSAMSFSAIEFILSDDVHFNAFCDYLRSVLAKKEMPAEEIESDYTNGSIRIMLDQTMKEQGDISIRAERHMDNMLNREFIFMWRG